MRLTALGLCLTFLLLACARHEKLGVGQGSRTLGRCRARPLPDGGVQLVAEEGEDRLYAELEAAPEQPSPQAEIAPRVLMLRLGAPLEPDEAPVYLGSEVRVRLSSLEPAVHGRIQGPVRDLERGRSHDLRARFRCAWER